MKSSDGRGRASNIRRATGSREQLDAAFVRLQAVVPTDVAICSESRAREVIEQLSDNHVRPTIPRLVTDRKPELFAQSTYRKTGTT